MRGRVGDCEVDLAPTACVGEMVTHGGFAVTSTPAVIGPLREDGGSAVVGNFERFYLICFVREV